MATKRELEEEIDRLRKTLEQVSDAVGAVLESEEDFEEQDSEVEDGSVDEREEVEE